MLEIFLFLPYTKCTMDPKALPPIPSTWKRILLAGFFLILFMGASVPFVVWGLVPMLEASPDSMMPFFLFFFGYTVLLILFMQFLTVRIFSYPGIGPTQPKERVQAELREVASWIPGVEVREKGKTLQFRYTYLDTIVNGRVTEHRAKQTFIVGIRFREDQQNCLVTNTWIRRYNIAPSWWGFGMWTWSIQRGMIASVQYDRQIGFDVLRGRIIQEGTHWNTEDLQQAVLGTLVKNGWSVHASLF